MAKKKYYAVAKGKTPGIYFTWEDCKAQIEHVSGAVYKSFPTLAEAEQFVQSIAFGEQLSFLEETKEPTESAAIETSGKEGSIEVVSTDTHLIAYVDGSYEHSLLQYAYGCAIILPDEVVTLNGCGSEEDYVSMRNVAGEILGSEQAILWAVEHGYQKITIYYDYEGIEKWANDIWKANKPGTQRYKAFVAEQRKNIEISFCKVAAHTGVEYNELADKLAKQALGIE